MIAIKSNAAERMEYILDRAAQIASLDAPTKKEQREHDTLLAEQATLRGSLTSKDLASIDFDRLSKTSGSVTRLSNNVRAEYRQWFNNKLEKRFIACGPHEVREARNAQEVGSQSITWSDLTAGGAFVPHGYADRNLRAMRQWDEVFDDANCNVISTPTGNPISIPSFDDTNNVSQIVGENVNPGPGATYAANTTSFKQSYSFRTGLVYVSLETVQDQGRDAYGGESVGMQAPDLIEACFATRHALGVGPYLITGAGDASSQPQGLLTAAVEADNVVYAGGANVNTGIAGDTNANSIGTPDLVSLFFALNRAYRRESIFAMNDATFQNISSLVDKAGQPLVRYNGDLNLSTLYGRRIIICPSMPSIAPNAMPIVHYVPRYFVVRRVAAGSFLQKLTQVPGAAEFGAVAFAGWHRTDSQFVVPSSTPGYAPIAALQMGS